MLDVLVADEDKFDTYSPKEKLAGFGETKHRQLAEANKRWTRLEQANRG